jgi:two-component system sensor histidine kinase TctE
MRDGDAAWGNAGSGTGLGLAICREIVDSAGGTIVLTNREQLGRVAGLDAVVGLPLGEPAARA